MEIAYYIYYYLLKMCPGVLFGNFRTTLMTQNVWHKNQNPIKIGLLHRRRRRIVIVKHKIVFLWVWVNVHARARAQVIEQNTEKY